MARFHKVDANKKFPHMEREVIAQWKADKTFEKSISNRDGAPTYMFYDGPPFATGLPHYGHIVGSVIKDVVPRYWTMRGYRVERLWGWDCHGLPIENIVEKELGSQKKKDIEKIGVETFNNQCRSKVMLYAAQWQTVMERLGRWADMRGAYRTMDTDYMESVWWVFKSLWDKGLIYKDYRAMHICPRCETTLSQQEVSEGYQDIKDLSVVAKFELVDEPGTFVLAWTTTPWTLPGNVALAVGEEIEYVKVAVKGEDGQAAARYIVAQKKADEVFAGKEYDIVEKLTGAQLVGKKYKPLFDVYYNDTNLRNRENGWKIYAGDFVTTDEGTGVVHIAPAFGEDDMRLGKEKNLPFVQHVAMDGSFTEELGSLAGLNVKPIGNHQATDVEIIKYLAKHGTLFSKQKYEHSYPHCWRCDTPLINYATSSWFVNVTEIKDKALVLAKDITWSPANMKEGRFGKWLAGARDWSISRQRFWASVMPVWVCEKCDATKVMGSVADVAEHFGNPNTLYLVRHGEAQSNAQGVINADLANNHYALTDKGVADITKLGAQLATQHIDLIVASPFLRTQQTAEIIARATGATVVTDDRLKEFDMGSFEGQKARESFFATFPKWPQDADEEARAHYGVEQEAHLTARLQSFVDELNKKYQDKNIVVVSHGDTLNGLYHLLHGTDRVTNYYTEWYPQTGTMRRVYSKPVDLHKHVVDAITLACEACGGQMHRVPDVLDTWFDSGSMPYAQKHYPFEHAEDFDKYFPADFIAEGVDQTRAWFYYQHVLATALKDSVAFKNVVVSGIVLAADGKKMSKKLQNYPDPMEMFEKYGSDSVRLYLMSSPVVAAQNLNFIEGDVAEVTRGMMRMLWNSYAFFTLYAEIDGWEPSAQWTPATLTHVLDRWIVSELHTTIAAFHTHMEAHELHKAARLFPPFIDGLSNWYIRRSRKRFWKSANDADKDNAYATLYYVLTETVKLLAPFAPFITEEVYRGLTQTTSVHMADAPVADAQRVDDALNENMRMTREVISAGLTLRAQAKIKVRQPLSRLTVQNGAWEPTDDMRAIVCEELNVKTVEMADVVDAGLTVRMDVAGVMIALDTTVTDALRVEGNARELIRTIQQLRKKAGYDVDDRITVGVEGCGAVMDAHGTLVAHEVLATTVQEVAVADADMTETVTIDAMPVTVTLRKNT